MRNFRNLHVWSDSIKLVDEVYQFTNLYPASEKWGLSNQMVRCAVSIPSNIAEGCSRQSNKEFSRFVQIALGSGFELETQLIISKNRGFIQSIEYELLLSDLHSIQKRLNALINSLKE